MSALLTLRAPAPWRRVAGAVRLPVASLLAALVVSGCSTGSYLVLVKDDDGRTGVVDVRTVERSVRLDRANTGVPLDGSATEPFEVGEDRIRTDFGPAIAARAAAPQTFLLYLESGSTKLTPESEQLIPRIVEAIRARTLPGVSIIGHTDTAGDARANQRLGQERAQLIAEHLGLVARGGAPARLGDLRLGDLTVTSHGESNPLVRTPDNTPEARNRRVEVTIR